MRTNSECVGASACRRVGEEPVLIASDTPSLRDPTRFVLGCSVHFFGLYRRYFTFKCIASSTIKTMGRWPNMTLKGYHSSGPARQAVHRLFSTKLSSN